MPLPEALQTKSVAIWLQREIQVLYSIGNTYVDMEDYKLAFDTFEHVLEYQPENVELMSGLGRLALQLGDTKTAKQYGSTCQHLLMINCRWFGRADALQNGHPQGAMNNAFLAMSRRMYIIDSCC